MGLNHIHCLRRLFSPCTSLLGVGVRLFLCMRLVSTMSSPLHAAICWAFSLHAAGLDYVESAACGLICSAIPLHAAGFDSVESAACGYRFGHSSACGLFRLGRVRCMRL